MQPVLVFTKRALRSVERSLRETVNRQRPLKQAPIGAPFTFAADSRRTFGATIGAIAYAVPSNQPKTIIDILRHIKTNFDDNHKSKSFKITY